MGANAWKSFPSVHIPEKFTREKLCEYFRALPPVTYSNGQGVLAALQPYQPDVDSESDSDMDEEDELPCTEELQSQPRDFNALCKRAVMKCIDRGERYKHYGFVIKPSIVDAMRDHYFLKAQVNASMEQDMRSISVTISKDSGDICNATCTCKASALRRCGHIAAVLLTVLHHIALSGHEGNIFNNEMHIM